MERWRITEKLPTIVGTALSAYLLYKLSFSAVENGDVKQAVRERADHTCEGCGEKNLGTIISHMNHKRNEYYEALNNLKLHCWGCEGLHHLSFIGKAKQIGMTEKDNREAAHGALTYLAIESTKHFEEVYWRRGKKNEIDALFVKLGTNYDEFMFKNEHKRPKNKSRKYVRPRQNPKPARI